MTELKPITPRWVASETGRSQALWAANVHCGYVALRANGTWTAASCRDDGDMCEDRQEFDSKDEAMAWVVEVLYRED